MTIVQQPEPISLTGNVKDFIIRSDEEVSFALSVGGTVIVNELYTPNANGEIAIGLTDILNAELLLSLPGAVWITEQPMIARTFTALINDTSISFTALRGGVDGLDVSSSIYLRQHFLTGQPALKHISREQPEYLSYYAVEDCTLCIDGGSGIKNIAQLEAGKVYLFNLGYAQAKFLTGNDSLESFEVWVAFSDGTTNDRQGYRYVNNLGPDEEYFMWENGLGGLDVARFTGQSMFTPKQTHNAGYFRQRSREYRTDVEKVYNKNTGHKQRDEYLWLYDFLMRNNRYRYIGGQFLPIVLDKSTLQYPSHEYVTSFSFDYRFSDSKPYLKAAVSGSDTVAYWSEYQCQRQAPPLEYVFVFAANDSSDLQHSSGYAGETFYVDILSLESGAFLEAVTVTNTISGWLTLVSTESIYAENKVRATFTAAQNADTLRSGVVELTQANSGITIRLTVTQAAGSYPLLLNVKEAQNALASRVELTLDNSAVVPAEFVGTQLQTVHIAAARRINSVRLLVLPNVYTEDFTTWLRYAVHAQFVKSELTQHSIVLTPIANGWATGGIVYRNEGANISKKLKFQLSGLDDYRSKGGGVYNLRVYTANFAQSRASVNFSEDGIYEYDVITDDIYLLFMAVLSEGAFDTTANSAQITLTEIASYPIDVDAADVTVKALPNGEINQSDAELPLPIDKSYAAIPPIAMGGSNEIDIQITPNVPLQVTVLTQVQAQYSENGVNTPYAGARIGISCQNPLNVDRQCYFTCTLRWATYDENKAVTGYGSQAVGRQTISTSTGVQLHMTGIPAANGAMYEVTDLVFEPLDNTVFTQQAEAPDFSFGVLKFTAAVDSENSRIALTWLSDFAVNTNRYTVRLTGTLSFSSSGEVVRTEQVDDSTQSIYNSNSAIRTGMLYYGYDNPEGYDVSFAISHIYLSGQNAMPKDGHALGWAFVFWRKNFIDLAQLSSYTQWNSQPVVSGNTITTVLAKASASGMNLTLRVNGYTPAAQRYRISGVMKLNGLPVAAASWLYKGATSEVPAASTTYFYVEDATGFFDIVTEFNGSVYWLLHTRIAGAVSDTITIEGLMFTEA